MCICISALLTPKPWSFETDEPLFKPLPASLGAPIQRPGPSDVAQTRVVALEVAVACLRFGKWDLASRVLGFSN